MVQYLQIITNKTVDVSNYRLWVLAPKESVKQRKSPGANPVTLIPGEKSREGPELDQSRLLANWIFELYLKDSIKK